MLKLVVLVLCYPILLIAGFVQYLYERKLRSKEHIKINKAIKRVCIIGAGASGITAAKEFMHDKAFQDVVVYEQSNDIGGNWTYSENVNHSSVYKTTYINTSRQMMSYSDYPMPDDMPIYPHNSHIKKYFDDFVDHFNVRKRIRFNTRVISVEERQSTDAATTIANGSATCPPSQWVVTVEKLSADGSKTGEIETSIFDAVIVANGHHWDPNEVRFPGMDKFKGLCIHSHAYKSPHVFKDKRVVIVGFGNSAMDAAVDLSNTASQVHLSARTQSYVIPKFSLGMPSDFVSTTRLLSMLPLSIRNAIARLTFKMRYGDIRKYGLNPQYDVFSTHPTINDSLLHLIGHGCIRLRPNIQEFTETGVIFEDGTEVDADVVILCTGYKITFPFLSEKLLRVDNQNRVDLYRFVFPPQFQRTTLAFIGLIQPLGAIMPISEMQVRWIKAYFKGEVGLPSESDMKDDIKATIDNMNKRYKRSPRHTIQVDFVDYMHELASRVGCYPRLWKHLFTAQYLVFGGALPYQYRIDGPDGWDRACDEIKKTYFDVSTTLAPKGSFTRITK